jgi:hypothetical protein
VRCNTTVRTCDVILKLVNANRLHCTVRQLQCRSKQLRSAILAFTTALTILLNIYYMLGIAATAGVRSEDH